jgi:hypothetical protein
MGEDSTVRAVLVRAGRDKLREMAEGDTPVRAVHDATQAAWFGSALLGAVAVDRATRVVRPEERIAVADRFWRAWRPLGTSLILAHLLTGGLMAWRNRTRLGFQEGALATNAAKTAVTGVALGTQVTVNRLGRQVAEGGAVAVGGSTTPAAETPDEVAAAQRRLKAAQWALVGLTGALVVLGARMGQQQRPKELLPGVAKRLSRG